MNRPRIHFIVESGTDVRLVDGLAERSELTVIGRTIRGGRIINWTPAAGVPVAVGPASRARFAGVALVGLLRKRRQFDAVLVQGYGLAAFAANVASRLVGLPTFMLVCSPVELYYSCRKSHHYPGMPYRRHELWILQLLAAINARIGRHYVVLSQHLKDVVSNHGTRRPVSVIPLYGVDTDRLRPPSDPKSVLRRRLGLPESGSMLFFSSRVAPEKDSETLLEALVRLRQMGHDLHLLNLSGGHAAFLAAADRYGVADCVITRDAVHPVHELAEYYQASDLCVQASREEGLGFSPLEALASEIPVVAAAVGGLRETVVNGETGWTYQPGNPASLAESIQAALDHPVESGRRAAAGRSMVKARYERRAAFEALLDLINGKMRSTS